LQERKKPEVQLDSDSVEKASETPRIDSIKEGDKRWRSILSGCYFLLVALAALVVIVFAPRIQDFIARIIVAVVVATAGVIAYASFRLFHVGKKLESAYRPNGKKDEDQKSSVVTVNQIVSLIAIVAVVVAAGLSAVTNHASITVVLVGAIGGLVHEIAQSSGKYVLPNLRIDSNNCTQDVCLGGLYGLISGGVAGLLLLRGMGQTIVSPQVLSEAFLAGVAVKGITDAAAGNAITKKRSKTESP
jgi:hypothetical protein